VTAEDSTLPETPTDVTWVVSGDSFVGEWNPVELNVNNDFSLITRYEVELTGNGNVVRVVAVPQQTASRISYTLSFEGNRALFENPSATVTMRVRAVDNKGLKSNYSDPITASNPPPGPPGNLVAVGITDAVNLNWTEPTDDDIVGYVIHASVTSGFDATGINKVGFTAGTFFQHTTSNYTQWHYIVMTMDKFGTLSTPARATAEPVSPFGVDTVPPPEPEITQATLTTNDATTRTTLKVDWNYPDPPNDLAEFVLRYRAAGTTAWEYLTIPSGADSPVLTATITGVAPYVNYEVGIKARDFAANESDWTLSTTANAATNQPPSTPATPTANANALQIQVTHTGNRATGAAMEADVVEYEVYASTQSGFTTYDNTTLLGKIPAGPAIVGTFDIPAQAVDDDDTNQRWYVKVRAVDRGGLRSPASGQAQADVGLISTTSIANASITSAKIANLDVTKLTAGDGLVTDFTIKSKLTIGDADTNGIIESFGFVQGVSGYRLNKSGLEVNDGAIQAKALKIQDSPNVMHPAYSDFEHEGDFYLNPFWSFRGLGKLWTNGPATNATEIDAPARFGRKALSVNYFSAPNAWAIWFGESTTDYNVGVEPDTKYIVSMYMYNRSPDAAGTVGDYVLRVKDETGSIFATHNVSMPNDSTWRRFQFVITVPAGVRKILVGVDKPDTTKQTWLCFDGVQVERVQGGLEEASPWKAPASTTINGAGIVTGLIRSNQNVTVNGVQHPVWSINLAGNAQFGDASIRGKLIVGPPTGTDNGNSFIASGNYVEASAGWKIKDNGNTEFANITSRAPNGTRTEITNANNPYESGQQWNVISMFSHNTAWAPAQIWVNYIPGAPNSAVMQLASPKLGGASPARISLSSRETASGTTTISLNAERVESAATSYFFGTAQARNILYMDNSNFIATANQYVFGDPTGTNVIIKVGYAGPDGSQRFSFRSPGDKRIDFSFNELGKNLIISKNEADVVTRLDTMFTDSMFNIVNANGNLYMGGASQMSTRPILGNAAGNCAIVFPADTEIRMTSINGGAYIDARAARWLTPSDMRFKSDVTEASEPMRQKLKELKAYDYVREPHVKMTAKERREAEKAGLVNKKRYRGMSAQEIQRVMPEVVVDDNDGDSGLAVDLYALLANTIQAFNELQSEVDDLREQLASK